MNDLPAREKNFHQQVPAKENSEYDLTLQLLSGDMQCIHDMILAGSAGIRAKDLYAIIPQRELIGNTFAAISSEYDRLKDQIWQIMRTLEAAAPVNATDPLPECLIEGTFAAHTCSKKKI